MIESLKNQLTKDKKALVVLVGLLAVALLFWGRMLYQKVPRRVAAEPAAQTARAWDQWDSAPRGSFVNKYHEIDYGDFAGDLPRDLFALDEANYEQINTATPVNPDPGNDDRTTEPVERGLEQLILGDTILSERRPRALINGKVIKLGQKINGFAVQAVKFRSVTLEKDGIRYELKMIAGR